MAFERYRAKRALSKAYRNEVKYQQKVDTLHAKKMTFFKHARLGSAVLKLDRAKSQRASALSNLQSFERARAQAKIDRRQAKIQRRNDLRSAKMLAHQQAHAAKAAAKLATKTQIQKAPPKGPKVKNHNTGTKMSRSQAARVAAIARWHGVGGGRKGGGMRLMKPGRRK